MSALKAHTPTGAFYKDADRDSTKFFPVTHILKVMNVDQ